LVDFIIILSRQVSSLLHGVYKLSYNKLISLKEKGERKDKERGKRKSLPKKKKISFIKNITCSK
jgi:hypothetical protein